MIYSLLADVIVAVHLAYVAFVVVGQVLILAGLLLGWRWVRNPWFRWLHLLAILIVAVESLGGVECPLTKWENQLQVMAGTEVEQGRTFIGQLLHDVLFFDVPFDHWGFTVAYVGFALLVLATLVLAPPRRRRKAALPADEHASHSAGNAAAAEIKASAQPPCLSATTRSESTPIGQHHRGGNP